MIDECQQITSENFEMLDHKLFRNNRIHMYRAICYKKQKRMDLFWNMKEAILLAQIEAGCWNIIMIIIILIVTTMEK